MNQETNRSNTTDYASTTRWSSTPSARLDGLQILVAEAAGIDGDRDDLGTQRLSQPEHAERRIETA